MLSELQKTIVGGLNLCGMEQDDIIGIMLMLKGKEAEQWEMANYLETIVDNPPKREVIFSEAVKISKMGKE